MSLLTRPALRGVVVGVLSCFVIAGGALASTVDLRPKLRKGDVVKYDIDINSDHDFGAGSGSPQKQEINQDIGVTMTVVESDPAKGATVEMVYDRIKYRSRGNLTTADFDSSQPASKDAGNRAAEALRPLIGTKLTLTIDPDGNVTEVKGGEQFAESFLDQIQGAYVSSAGVNGMFGPIFASRQAKTHAAVGDSWTYVDSLPSMMFGDLKLTTTHTLKSIKGELANVDLSGKIELSNKDVGMNISMSDSTYEGSYVWDAEAGMLKSMKTHTNANIRGDIVGGAVNVKSKTTTTITRTN